MYKSYGYARAEYLGAFANVTQKNIEINHQNIFILNDSNDC